MKYAVKECIYSKQYATRKGLFDKIKSLFCVHVWQEEELVREGLITLEKSKCVFCGIKEIMMFIDW